MKKRLLTITPLIIASMISHPLSAQFSQYKSKTKFSKSKATKAPSQKSALSIKNYDDTKEAEKNIFGRQDSVSDEEIKKYTKDKKYVNLNPETAFGPEVVTSFDFPDTSLKDLTEHMQKLTGINLIVDKALKGKISITAPTPITIGDAWKAYLTALNVNGYSLVKSGAFYKIVNTRDIRYVPTKIYTGSYTPSTENYAMRILPLKHITASEVTRSFRPFMSRYGRILDIRQTNTIIIQDTGDNINRLVRLIQFVDVPGHEETLQIIKVRNTSAQEIAKLLDKILDSKTKKTSRTSRKSTNSEVVSKIIAEPRTNSIIAMANAEGGKRLRQLINQLDVKVASQSSGKIHVYYLNYGDSETLAKTLSSLVSGSTSKKTSSRFRRSSSTENESLFNAEVKITADKDNNALVVTASPTDYLTIKDVIKKLDIPKDQVYLEGLIMETNISKENSFGTSIVGAYGKGGAGLAGSNANSSAMAGLISGQVTSLGGLFAGIGVGNSKTRTINGQDVSIQSVNGLITAIAADGNTNILATPQLLAQDNTEAVFEVGETVPISETTNSANGSSTFATKEQKIALTLKFTPQINKVTRFIKLKIDQKIEDFSQRELPQSLADKGVATTTRKAVTTVTVRDRDTIAMGGLMRDKTIDTESKVPLLGDIPVLGWLFKTKSKKVEKVNLLFFLTPKIMSSYENTMAENTIDALDTRYAHLRENFDGEDIPHQDISNDIYQKAIMQKKAPLYKKDANKRYLDENQKGENDGSDMPFIAPIDDQSAMFDHLKGRKGQYEAPNYQKIIQEVKSRKSAIKR